MPPVDVQLQAWTPFRPAVVLVGAVVVVVVVVYRCRVVRVTQLHTKGRPRPAADAIVEILTLGRFYQAGCRCIHVC